MPTTLDEFYDTEFTAWSDRQIEVFPQACPWLPEQALDREFLPD
jgi:hypothetical protein